MLIVDDGSPDGTADLAEELERRARPDRGHAPYRKTGLGAAYRAGLRAAIDDGAEICVQMDADLSHDPAVLPALIANVEHGADLRDRQPLRARRPHRELAATAPHAVAVGQPLRGGRARPGGQRRHRRVPRLPQPTRSSAWSSTPSSAEGYGFQVEMTYRLVRIGGKVVEFPITFRDRTAGESKMSGGIVREALVIVIKLWVDDFGGRRRRRAQGG